MNTTKAVIRKNSDRRLYHSAESRYVKLEDIARMLRDGMDVQVVDSRNGKDITRVILTQVIVEETRGQETGPPLPLLKQLVMASDRATHEFLSWYLSSTLELYHKAQQAVQTKVSDARTAVSGPLDFVRNLLAGRTFPPTLDAAEVAELRQRVLELEARVAELSGSAPAVRADSETRSPRKRASPRRRVRQ
jgi:polyhydroxyalkanoate synthesis repressor PhaR